MKPGKLACIITVQRWNASAVNDFGTETGAWQHLATLRAELVTLTIEEAMATRGAGDETALVFRIRNKVQIGPADRLAFRAQWHSIKEVMILPDAFELHCVTFKGQSA